MENGKIEFAVKALIFNGEKFLAVHKSTIQSLYPINRAL